MGAGRVSNIHVGFFHFRDKAAHAEELQEPFRALLSSFLPTEHIFSYYCQQTALSCGLYISGGQLLARHQANESTVGHSVIHQNTVTSHPCPFLFVEPYRTKPFLLPFVCASINKHNDHCRRRVLDTPYVLDIMLATSRLLSH